jgi:hypothetical protein
VKIEPRSINVRDLTEGYQDNSEGGVIGYGGRLDIRPPYQREFVYKDVERDRVIDTLRKGYPLNVMYWVVREEPDAERAYEVMDGQQRTISISQYVAGDFAFEGRYFHNLQADEQEQILNYELTVYFCSGTDSEKLGWFRTINIAGVELSQQEMRNAVYAGPWVTDAKRYFSRRNCPAHGLAEDLMSGEYLRQKYLETVVSWVNTGNIEDYMASNQHKPNANELWLYFNSVVNWVRTVFPTYRKEMKGLPWGELYNAHKDRPLDSAALEVEVARLMRDEDVERKRGIYEYILDGQERHLNIRAFSDKDKREAYERQAGICVKCGAHFAIEDMEADHITPWHEGGKTNAANCQMLCRLDNRSKGGR